MERRDLSLENFHGTVTIFISVSDLCTLLLISSHSRGDSLTHQLLPLNRGETFPRVTVLRLYMLKNTNEINEEK